jgi:alkyl hydroperoxide reductase subunit AhpC
MNADVVAISTDSKFSHKAWATRDLPGVKYALLSDTTQAISKAYGVLLESKGIALRGTFIVDPKGVLQWSSVNDLSTGRSIGEIIRVLQGLQSGANCPVNWTKGQATL